MKVRVLYFARLRERFGLGEETVEVAGTTAGAVVDALRARGDVWAEELAPGRSFRVAVNQEIAALDAPLSEGAEVAIFPPVTGG